MADVIVQTADSPKRRNQESNCRRARPVLVKQPRKTTHDSFAEEHLTNHDPPSPRVRIPPSDLMTQKSKDVSGKLSEANNSISLRGLKLKAETVQRDGQVRYQDIENLQAQIRVAKKAQEAQEARVIEARGKLEELQGTDASKRRRKMLDQHADTLKTREHELKRRTRELIWCQQQMIQYYTLSSDHPSSMSGKAGSGWPSVLTSDSSFSSNEYRHHYQSGQTTTLLREALDANPMLEDSDSDDDDDYELQLLWQLLQNGHARYDERDFAAAEDNFREAYTISQANDFQSLIVYSTAECRLVLVVCLVKQDKYEEAIRILSQMDEAHIDQIGQIEVKTAPEMIADISLVPVLQNWLQEITKQVVAAKANHHGLAMGEAFAKDLENFVKAFEPQQEERSTQLSSSSYNDVPSAMLQTSWEELNERSLETEVRHDIEFKDSESLPGAVTQEHNIKRNSNATTSISQDQENRSQAHSVHCGQACSNVACSSSATTTAFVHRKLSLLILSGIIRIATLIEFFGTSTIFIIIQSQHIISQRYMLRIYVDFFAIYLGYVGWRMLGHSWSYWQQRKGFGLVTDVSLSSKIARILRPKRKLGMTRLEWRCSCGETLFGDFKERSSGSLQRLARQLGASYQPGPFQQTVCSSSIPFSHAAQCSGASSSAGETIAPLSVCLPNGNGSQISSRSSYSIQTTDTLQRRQKFLEICIPSKEGFHKLNEVIGDYPTTDRVVFENIRQKYYQHRKTLPILRKVSLHGPKVANFIRLKVFKAPLVSVFRDEPSFPPQKEVNEGRYEYDPVPMDEPPMPSNVFMHFLTTETQAHNTSLWTTRLPYRLGSPLNCASAEMASAWGIEIEEGPLMFTFSIMMITALFLSGALAAVYGSVMQDAQTGVALGAWLTAIQTVVMMILFFRWAEDVF